MNYTIFIIYSDLILANLKYNILTKIVFEYKYKKLTTKNVKKQCQHGCFRLKLVVHDRAKPYEL